MTKRIGSNWSERLHSPLARYIAGVVVLTMIPLILGAWFITEKSFGTSNGEEELSRKRAQIASLREQLATIRGVNQDIAGTRSAIDNFYATRISTSYSILTGSLGTVAAASGVQLNQVTYDQGTPGSDLMEISMEAGVNGGYRQVMRFVNGLERDRVFYVIRAISLEGQQSGSVTLRVRVSTWMKPGGPGIHQVEPTTPGSAATAMHQAELRPGGK